MGIARITRRSAERFAIAKTQLVGAALVALLFVMVLSGALVAGTHAGLVFNTFPLMGDHFVPPDLLAYEPAWRNLFENQITIQFVHRMFAWFMFIAIFLYCWRAIVVAFRVRRAALMVVVMVIIQVSLGIATLLNAVPVPLGAAHQVGAMVLFALLLYLNHALRVTQC